MKQGKPEPALECHAGNRISPGQFPECVLNRKLDLTVTRGLMCADSPIHKALLLGTTPHQYILKSITCTQEFNIWYTLQKQLRMKAAGVFPLRV